MLMALATDPQADGPDRQKWVDCSYPATSPYGQKLTSRHLATAEEQAARIFAN